MSYSSEMNNPKDLHGELNNICTYLWEGEAWHEKTANECRKLSIRGWGRWHDEEAICDARTRISLEKLLQDKLSYSPTIDMSAVENAQKHMLSRHGDFKTHHTIWIDREEKLIACLNKAISMASMADMELYKKLCCIVDEVQNEAMRVRLAYTRLDMAEWQGHDIGVCSMIIHKYFECDYKPGDSIDFNIG